MRSVWQAESLLPKFPQFIGKANPIIAGSEAPSIKVYHSVPHKAKNKEKPISKVYAVIDNDLARDNIENDMTFANMQDM